MAQNAAAHQLFDQFLTLCDGRVPFKLRDSPTTRARDTRRKICKSGANDVDDGGGRKPADTQRPEARSPPTPISELALIIGAGMAQLWRRHNGSAEAMDRVTAESPVTMTATTSTQGPSQQQRWWTQRTTTPRSLSRRNYDRRRLCLMLLSEWANEEEDTYSISCYTRALYIMSWFLATTSAVAEKLRDVAYLWE